MSIFVLNKIYLMTRQNDENNSITHWNLRDSTNQYSTQNLWTKVKNQNNENLEILKIE